jgi:hypothetical protein
MIRLVVALLAVSASGTDWSDLFNGRDLTGWEVVGDGDWSAPGGGILVGQCDLRKPCHRQSWLYTKEEFGEFDLKLSYFLRLGGNSGVSIWDTSRARYAVDPEADGRRTPSHVGYEINIDNDALKGFDVTGSIYLIAGAKGGIQKDREWNTLEIHARHDAIEVLVNGIVVANHALLPERPTRGPIGLQLHDSRDVVLFRDVQIRRPAPPAHDAHDNR